MNTIHGTMKCGLGIELGLRSEKVDVYEQVFDSSDYFVENIYVYSDGAERSLENITIAGAYYVYINHL